MNCNKLGGLAECSEENVVNNLTIKHIANHCSAHFALHGIDCEIETKLSAETIACLTKINKLSPHQFTQAFKRRWKETSRNVLSLEWNTEMREVCGA